MASTSVADVAEVADEFETLEVASDDTAPPPETPTAVAPVDAVAVNVETPDTPDAPLEPERVFNAPNKCYGLKWNASKGLVFCSKAPVGGECKFAFCGRAHKKAFEENQPLASLFYAFVAITNTTRQDLRPLFTKTVVPHFIVNSVRNNRRHPTGPLYLVCEDDDDFTFLRAYLVQASHPLVYAFYQSVQEDLIEYCTSTAFTTGLTAEECIRGWDDEFNRLLGTRHRNDIHFRFLFDLRPRPEPALI